MYGKFLIHIKNDEEEGMTHINLSKKIIATAAASNIIDMKDLSNDATQAEIPSCIISADLKSLGRVMMINTTLAKNFGFQKATLIGVNVKGL